VSLGWFDPLLREEAWFDPLLVEEAWFDELLISADEGGEEEPAGPPPGSLAMTGCGR
jgi:hypothetical protein